MGSGRVRQKYDQDFKREAVQLAEEGGHSVRQVAANLGISKDLLYKWRYQIRDKNQIAFPGNGIPALTAEQRRIKELEKELMRTQRERDILKKATAIFSRELQ